MVKEWLAKLASWESEDLEIRKATHSGGLLCCEALDDVTGDRRSGLHHRRSGLRQNSRRGKNRRLHRGKKARNYRLRDRTERTIVRYTSGPMHGTTVRIRNAETPLICMSRQESLTRSAESNRTCCSR